MSEGDEVAGQTLAQLAERIVDSAGEHCPCCAADDGWWSQRTRDERIETVLDMLAAPSRA